MATLTAARTWTYADLFALPDGKRYEIIEGDLFEMPAPSFAHSTAIANLMILLAPVVAALRGIIRTAPLDVFLPDGDPVQPDLVVLLPDRFHLIRSRGIEGPPSLVIEVLSPSNPEHDRTLKRRLYARAGIPEYWLVSPEAGLIEVLALMEGKYRTVTRAIDDEVVASTILPGLTFSANAVFTVVQPA